MTRITQDSGGGHRDRVSESREIIKALVLDSGPIAGTAGPADFEPSVQRTSGDLRVQRRVPCELRRTFDGEWVGSPCIHLEDPARCDGCNGDGNRWVTVGALREWTVVDAVAFDGRRAYAIEEDTTE